MKFCGKCLKEKKPRNKSDMKEGMDYCVCWRPKKLPPYDQFVEMIEERRASHFVESWKFSQEPKLEKWKIKRKGNWDIITQQSAVKTMVAIKKPTVTWMADLFWTTRRTILDHQKKDNEFSHTIIEYKTKIEMWNEEQLYTWSYNGAKFNLINNFKWWAERTEQVNMDKDYISEEELHDD